MTHYEYKEKLSALLDGELSEAERDTVLAHLDACEDCRAYFAELNAMRGALGELEEYDAPEGFAAGVMARLHEEEAKKVSDFRAAAKARRPWRVWGTLAACAAVVLLAVSVLPNTIRMKSAAPEAMMAPATAPMAPGNEFRYGIASDAVAGGADAPEEAESDMSAQLNMVPVEPAAPAGGAEADNAKLRVASDSGVSPYIVTAGPNGETVSAPNEGESNAQLEASAAEDAPAWTLIGEGAAEWLEANGEPLGDGRWRVTVEAANALPDTLQLVGMVSGVLEEPTDGTLIITYGTTENPR